MDNLNQDKFYMQLVLESSERQVQELTRKLNLALEYVLVNGGKDHVDRVLNGEYADDILNTNQGDKQ